MTTYLRVPNIAALEAKGEFSAGIGFADVDGIGKFVWNNSSTATANGVDIVQATAVAIGRWLRIQGGGLSLAAYLNSGNTLAQCDTDAASAGIGWTLDATVTISAATTFNAPVTAVPGGRINRGTYLVTFNKPLTADLYAQVFDTSTSTSVAPSFAYGQEVSACWFGASGNNNGTPGNGTDNYYPIFDALKTKNNVVLPAGKNAALASLVGNYRITSQVYLQIAGQQIKGSLTANDRSDGHQATVIYTDGCSGIGTVQYQGYTQAIRDISFLSSDLTGANVYTAINFGEYTAGDQGKYCQIENVFMQGFQKGLVIGNASSATSDAYNYHGRGVRALNCQFGFYLAGKGHQQCTMDQCSSIQSGGPWGAVAGAQAGAYCEGGSITWITPRFEGNKSNFQGVGRGSNSKPSKHIFINPQFESAINSDWDVTADFSFESRGGYGGSVNSSGSVNAVYLLQVTANAVTPQIEPGTQIIDDFEFIDGLWVDGGGTQQSLSRYCNLQAPSNVYIRRLQNAGNPTTGQPNVSGKLYSTGSGKYPPRELSIVGTFSGGDVAGWTGSKFNFWQSVGSPISADLGTVPASIVGASDPFYEAYPYGGGKLKTIGLLSGYQTGDPSYLGTPGANVAKVVAISSILATNSEALIRIKGSCRWNDTFATGQISQEWLVSRATGAITATKVVDNSGSIVTTNTLIGIVDGATVVGSAGQAAITFKTSAGTNTYSDYCNLEIEIIPSTLDPARLFPGTATY